MTPVGPEDSKQMEFVEGTATVEDIDAFLAQVDEISEETGTTVQVFDARYVVDREHIERAVDLAGRARERGEDIARDPAVEILLYAAGRRQIDRALTMGVSEGDCPVVGVTVGGDEAAVADAADTLGDLLDPAETLGAFDETRIREFFDVTDRELDATAGTLEDIIHERVALLVVER
jgi:KEOPS complex subunit Cgi121